MAAGWRNQRRMLRDFVTSGIQGITSSITRPSIDANNFKLKPALIFMVQQSQLGGTPLEDLNLHLSVFLEVCETSKVNGVCTDAFWLRLFFFSLRDRARAWLHSFPLGCITTWDGLTRSFLTQFFPLSKMASLRNQITNFTQRGDKMLYEAWERLKDLLRLCPHQGLQWWVIIQAFCNGVTQFIRSTIDTTVGGTLMSETKDEAYNLIEEIALNNFQWSTGWGQPKWVRGKLEVDALTFLSAKVDAMSQRLDRINVNAVNSSSPPLCEICGSIEYTTLNCQVRSLFF